MAGSAAGEQAVLERLMARHVGPLRRRVSGWTAAALGARPVREALRIFDVADVRATRTGAPVRLVSANERWP